MAEAMDLCSSPPGSSNTLKRPLPADEQHGSPVSNMPTPPLTASPNQGAGNREPSPALSTSTLSSVATSTHERPPGSNGAPPQKKRKLTFAEKEVQRIEKEHKKKEREELKAKREEEKRLRDEEKRRKREEKEAKDRERDLEKQRKEEEKQRKDEEKQRKEEERSKKERAQTKLSFFTKPKLPATASPNIAQSADARETILETTRRKSLSVEPNDDTFNTAPTTPSARQTKKTDYERKFLPFQPPSHTTCAPLPIRSFAECEASQLEFDSLLQHILNEQPPTENPAPASSFFTNIKARSRGLWQPKAREVMDSIHGTSNNPIDLDSGESCRPEDLLNAITIRHLHFAEDVRPPYVGSYTKTYSPRSSAKLRRNPFKRVRKDTNYDYDSEAEWEEPEEGEDLLSDADDDEESVGAEDEMEDFLDEDDGPKRGLITGDLKPLSTGICWEGCDQNPEPSIDLDSMKLQFFLDLPARSINPFYSVYWPSDARAPLPPTDVKPVIKLENGKIVTPRQPLQPRLTSNGSVAIIGAASGMSGPIMATGPGKLRSTAKALVGTELTEFREAVVGSNIPKTDLLKLLKKRFPQHTNDTIKVTLTDCFEFSGSSRAEKRWTIAE